MRTGKIAIFLLLIFQSAFLFSKTIRVPQDFLTIKTAVLASRVGDVVEVDDGNYFEKNIIIDKNIKIKTRTLYGAVVHGRLDIRDSIFIVRAKADIEGFVFKNSFLGILQRDSPDTVWHGRDLAFYNMKDSAIDVNDQEKNVGSAHLENIIIENSGTGVGTNDAREIRLQNGIIVNCKTAFRGENHVSFYANLMTIWQCPAISNSGTLPILPPATHDIVLGPDLNIWHGTQTKENIRDSAIAKLMSSMSAKSDTPDNVMRRCGLIDVMSAEAFFRNENMKRAEKYFQDALDAGRISNSGEIVLRAIYGLARIAEKTGDAVLSVNFYEEAIREIDLIVKGLPLKFYQAGFFDDKVQIYESLINSLYRMHLKDPDKSYAKEAFLYSEKSKASGIFAALDSPPASGSLLQESENNRKVEALSEKISRLQRALSEQNRSPNDRRGDLEMLEDVEDEYKAFLMKLDLGKNGGGKKGVAHDFGYEDIKSILTENGCALIEYFLGKEHSFAFFVAQDGIEMARLPASKSLDSFVSNYLDFVELNRPNEFLGTRGGRILYEILIGPFQKKLAGVQKLIIIPDGILHYLPFETLIFPAGIHSGKAAVTGTRSFRYLLEDCEMSYSPAASCLLQLKNKQKIGPQRYDMLAVAYPGGEGHGFSMLAGPFPRLNYVNQEVRSIGAMFNRRNAKSLIGNEAKEEEIKKMNLSEFNIIHFATHGLLDDKYWWRSGLLLRRDAAGFEDGILQPLDLFKIRLNADLVVLSACQSGKGRIERGEGLMGISLSFFLAGARTIVSSLWSLNDRSTAILMEDFYRNLTRGKPIGMALRTAKIAMLDSKYSHPRYWAPFVVIGDEASAIRSGRSDH